MRPPSCCLLLQAVLGAIQKQLLQCDQVSSSSVRHVPAKPKAAEAAPADVMPSAEQLLSAVAAAAGAQQHTAAAASIASLPELWQQLLALLFPAAAVDAAASSSATSADPYPLFAAATLGISAGGINAALADEEDTLPSDGSWGEAAAGSEEEGWDEVQQHDEPQHSQQQRGLQKHGRAPGELLATAVDRQYVTSLRCCHIAARRALRAYVQVRVTRVRRMQAERSSVVPGSCCCCAPACFTHMCAWGTCVQPPPAGRA
jgi:hypothetical protein